MKIISNQFGTYYLFEPNSNIENNNKTIIFIHGFATTSEYHDHIAKYFTNDGYKYISIQLPGAGIEKWKNNKKPTVEDMVLYCINLINSLNLDNFYIIGHSMGGGIALRVSNYFNEKVIGCVLSTPMNSKISFLKVFNYFKFNPKNLKKAYKLNSILYFDFMKLFNYDQNKIENYINKEFEYQMKNRNFFIKLKKSMFSIKNLKNGRINEKNIKRPTLVIGGKYDKLIPIKSLYKAFFNNKKNNDIRIEILENSAHIPFQEEEKLYVNIIKEFFIFTDKKFEF